MKNLIKNLKGSDKMLHSKVGNLIFLAYFLPHWYFYSVWIALAVALAGVLAMGIAKELYDKYYKRTFIDWYDIVASLIPYPILKYIQKL